MFTIDSSTSKAAEYFYLVILYYLVTLKYFCMIELVNLGVTKMGG